MAIGESSDESDDELAELAIRKEEDFKAVKGMPGMYYKVYRTLLFENAMQSKCYISNVSIYYTNSSWH